VRLTVVALALIGSAPVIACGGGKGGGTQVASDAAEAVGATEAPRPLPRVADVPADTRSLRLVRTVAVRLRADDKSRRIGTLAGDTRVGWRDAAMGQGCTRPWYALEGQGWVCGDYVEASTRAPAGVELPRLDRDEIVPGVYGKVVDQGTNIYTHPPPPPKGKKLVKGGKDEPPPPPPPPVDQGPAARAAAAAGLVKGRPLLGSVNVRKYDELVSAGKVFWKISARDDEWLPASSIREHKPSDYRGTRLGDDTGLTLPIAFVWPRGGGTKVWTRGAVRGGGVRRQLSQRDPVPVLEVSEDKGKPVAYRIGDAEWIDASAVRVAMPTPLPPGVKAGERWLDIDLDTQILIAYEGDLPVYATMVSTGKKDTPTETGVYRVWRKASEADMKGLSGEDPYSVATVPWTQFYSPERGLALHTAYWHDKFGTQRSHGCTNLSPQDARWLYFFTDPQVPPGWSMAAGAVEAPGSVVRVRSAEDPEPPVRGYASKIDEPE
jgi:hypothetical protein